MEQALAKPGWRGVEVIGQWVIAKVHYYVDLSALLYLTFKDLIKERKNGFPLVFEITLRQIYFTGVQALKVVTLVALTLGTVVIVEVGKQVNLVGGIDFLAQILIVVIIRELGPLLTAFIVIGRSGTAIATELGNMIVVHELQAIRAMGINPIYFIVAPRIIGVTVAVICLTVYFNTVAMIGGFLLSKVILTMPFGVFFNQLMTSLDAKDLILAFLKSVSFGLLIVLTCVYHGLTVRYSPIEVPQATTRAVVSAIFSCVIFNVLFTVLFYL